MTHSCVRPECQIQVSTLNYWKIGKACQKAISNYLHGINIQIKRFAVIKYIGQ